MVSVLASSAVDHGFEPRSGQTKEYKIGICCFSAKHASRIDDEVRFVLDQQVKLDFNSASSRKQQSADRRVASTGKHYPDSEPTSLCSFCLMMRA
jgi:hypothetical protein